MSANGTSDATPSKTKFTKLVILKLSPARLAPFADTMAGRKGPKSKAAAVAATASDPTPNGSTPASPSANGAEAAASPTPVGTAADTKETSDGSPKKNTPGPKPGSKRGLGPDGLPKPRGKPGPKRRKLEDGADPNGAAAPAHKLGPRANQGAINAGLRALDRSGKPCRKWERKSLVIKSFTGVSWPLHRWGSQARPKPDESEKSSTTGQETPNGAGKGNASSSAIDSEKSNNGDNNEAKDIPASSPPAPFIAPVVAAPSAVTAEG